MVVPNTYCEEGKINPYLHSPSICLTDGASRRAGRGTKITTFRRSNNDEASYSMLTYVSFPEEEGQQLTAIETNSRLSYYYINTKVVERIYRL